MGMHVSYKFTCDVCSDLVGETSMQVYLNVFGATSLPPVPLVRTMGTRVLCDRCYNVLENVAVAIAPGVMATTEPPVRTAERAESSGP